ncbi:MAG TPA: hypothetical protein VGB53_14490 [Rubricoccaceae bacterium]
MSLRLFCLAVLCLLRGAAAAQSAAHPVSSIPEPLSAEAGDMALLFSAGGFGTGSFETGLGGKWWTTPAVAVAVGIRLGVDARETEASETVDGVASSRLETGFTLGAEVHAEGGRRLSPFVAVAVGMAADRERFETRPQTDLPASAVERVRREASVEGAVRLGAEFRLTPRLSLATAQGVRVVAFRGTERVTPAGSREEVRATSGYRIGLGAAALTLAVYL